jgi:hypothetical protein
MKYLFKTLLVFTLTFVLLKFLIYFFDTGHKINYNVGNFNIEETLTTKNNDYYFEIKNEDLHLNFQTIQNYNKASKVIKKIYYKKIAGYDCFLPIFKKGKVLTDMMCLKNSTITYAHDLGNKDINKYLKTIKEYKDIYKDKGQAITLSNTQTLYENNLLENNYVAMESYKGLNLFGSKTSNVKIFEDDVYKKPISYFTDKYYIVADYTENYTFKIFHVVNIINGQKTDIRSYDEISFDSYIEGAVDGDIYIFDKDAQKQYKISIKYENVEEVGNKDHIKYYNGKWGTITLQEALNEKKFENYYTNQIKGYDKTDKIGNYYYLYQKEKTKYNVYRADVQNKEIKTYLFQTTNLSSIIYFDNLIYYLNGDTFYYYTNCHHKLITNTELQFNSDISFGVYKK